MKFESIQLKNFRQYKDVTISFGDKINLIEAGNGVGKSTLMAAMIFAMFGYEKAKNSGFIEITAMTPLINLECLNEETEEFEVRVILSIRSDDQIQYKISRSYNRVTDKEYIEVKKTSKEDNYYSQDIGFEEVESIIPEEFIPLLFFDGERIKKIEDSISNNSKGFQDEIEKILKNSELNEARNLIRRARKKLSDETQFNSPKINELSNQIQERENFIERKMESIEKNKINLEDAEIKKEEINQKLKDYESIKEISEEIEILEDKIKELSDKCNESKMRAREQVFSNFPDLIRLNLYEKILEGMSGYSTNYKIVGIEQNAIDMIIENGQCICSTTLDDELIYKLKELRKVLPPESFHTVLSSKLDNKEEDKSKLKNHVSNYTNIFLLDEKELNKKKNELQVLKEKIVVGNEENDIGQLMIELEKTEEYIFEQKVGISKLEATIKLGERQMKEFKRDYDRELEKEKEKELEREAIRFMEDSEDEIKEYIKDRKDSLKGIMEKWVNDYADNLLSEDIEIELNSSLKPQKVRLKNRSESLSTGQSVIVSLSYLFALMKASKEEIKFGYHISLTEEYPLIFDGVTATLDDFHTRKVIDYIEETDNQFIIFANTKEVKLFEDRLNKDVKKFSLYKAKNSNELKVED